MLLQTARDTADFAWPQPDAGRVLQLMVDGKALQLPNDNKLDTIAPYVVSQCGNYYIRVDARTWFWFHLLSVAHAAADPVALL